MRRTLLAAGLVLSLGVLPQDPPGYEIYAVRYGTIKDFAVRSLIAGADGNRTLDIAMMVWVLRRPDAAVEHALGVRPDEVTDVIVTHIHWDHADGVDLFPRARIWIQREEYDHHIGANGDVLARAVDPDVAAMFAGLRAAGRVELVDGDDREILPGMRVYTGGKHTFASQYVGVATRGGTVVLASDNAYLYENLDRRLAIAQTLDPVSNLEAQARMLDLATARAGVVPGHDPQVFARFPSAGPRAVRID